MLAAIVILTVLGGVFAFKARHAFLADIYYTTAATYVGKTMPSISHNN